MNIFIIREILRLILTTQYSNRHIAKIIKVSANTVRRYRKRLKLNALNWNNIQLLNDDSLHSKLFSSKANLAGKRLPDWNYIHKLMQAKHQTLIELWEEYRHVEPGDAYSYSQFTHHHRVYMSQIDISMRQMHYAGECVYVDYAGKTISWSEPNTGEMHKAQIFVGVLGCSQYTFAWASRSQKVEDWIDAHNRMMQFFGGAPQNVVPDNLKSAVICPGMFPVLNRTYLEFSRHYGCVIEPARVRKPQDKSLAEIGVLLVTRWITVILRRRQFFSVAEINEAIPELLKKLNERPFKRLPGCRRTRFEELDKPVLQPLPEHPFEFASWVAAQKVPADYHLYILGQAYSVPYQFVGQPVEARVNRQKVDFYHQNKKIASHVRCYEAGGVITDESHRPSSHRAYAQQSKEYFLSWAKQIGESALAIINAQFENRPSYSISGCKACSQLQSLAQHYGRERFNAACLCACDIQSFTVSSVRSILQCKLDQSLNSEKPVQAELPLHYNVRGAQYYKNGGN